MKWIEQVTVTDDSVKIEFYEDANTDETVTLTAPIDPDLIIEYKDGDKALEKDFITECLKYNGYSTKWEYSM